MKHQSLKSHFQVKSKGISDSHSPEKGVQKSVSEVAQGSRGAPMHLPDCGRGRTGCRPSASSPAGGRDLPRAASRPPDTGSPLLRGCALPHLNAVFSRHTRNSPVLSARGRGEDTSGIFSVWRLPYTHALSNRLFKCLRSSPSQACFPTSLTGLNPTSYFSYYIKTWGKTEMTVISTH